MTGKIIEKKEEVKLYENKMGKFGRIYLASKQLSPYIGKDVRVIIEEIPK